MNKHHPFYCHKTNQRKTAWNTPEYLSAEDWEFLCEVIPALESGDAYLFHTTVFQSHEKAESFFYRMIGWPEGLTYCFNIRYLENFGLPVLVDIELPRLRQVVRG